jgi:hypothetical protein
MRVPPAQSGTACGAQRAVGVAAVEVARDAGQAGAERERLDAAPAGDGGLQEHHHRPRVRAHRARHVDDEDHLARHEPAPAGQAEHRRALGPHRAAHRAALVEHRAARRGLQAPGAAQRDGARDAREQPPRLAQLVVGVLGEVELAQALHGRPRHALGRVAVLGTVLVAARLRRVHRLAPHTRTGRRVAGRRRRLGVGRPGRGRLQGAVLARARLLPERREGGVEHLDVLVVGDQRAAQRPVGLLARGDVDGAERLEGVLHAARPDLEPAGAQHAPEPGDAAQHPLAGVGGHRHGAHPPRATAPALRRLSATSRSTP